MSTLVQLTRAPLFSMTNLSELRVQWRRAPPQVHHSKFTNKLMFSEWMEETPDDLAEAWFFKICPPGKRCLVISHRVRMG